MIENSYPYPKSVPKEERYEGETNDRGQAHGQGAYYNANGTRYEGEFKDGSPNGRGVFYYLEDNQWKGDRYEGEWKDGKQHGKGAYYHASGDRYEGEWKDGKRHGKGAYDYADGDRYEGEYKDDVEDGQGILHHANGDRYEGEWKDGIPHRGTPFFVDGSHYDVKPGDGGACPYRSEDGSECQESPYFVYGNDSEYCFRHYTYGLIMQKNFEDTGSYLLREWEPRDISNLTLSEKTSFHGGGIAYWGFLIASLVSSWYAIGILIDAKSNMISAAESLSEALIAPPVLMLMTSAILLIVFNERVNLSVSTQVGKRSIFAADRIFSLHYSRWGLSSKPVFIPQEDRGIPNIREPGPGLFGSLVTSITAILGVVISVSIPVLGAILAVIIWLVVLCVIVFSAALFIGLIMAVVLLAVFGALMFFTIGSPALIWLIPLWILALLR